MCVQDQKQELGNHLFPMVQKSEAAVGQMAGKVTGMLLEMDNAEVLMMLGDPALLKQKVKKRCFQSNFPSRRIFLTL